MTQWPHSWVAYLAGCRCDQCMRFDRIVFDRIPDRQSQPTMAQTTEVRT